MKKFKTKIRYSSIKWIFFAIILIMFFLLSFISLNKSYPKLVNSLLYQFNEVENDKYFFTNNLDYLLNTYYFKEKDNSNNLSLFQIPQDNSTEKDY